MTDYSTWKEADETNAPFLIIVDKGATVENIHKIKITPELQFIEKREGTCLDFGCGVGRNTYTLLEKFDNVIGYDFPNMLGMMKSTKMYAEHKDRITLSSDWSWVRKQKVELIFCCIVLQHIWERELVPYLSDFTYMSEELLLWSRSWCDDAHKNMYDLINRYWKIVEPI